jgi:hypothetical protein
MSRRVVEWGVETAGPRDAGNGVPPSLGDRDR